MRRLLLVVAGCALLLSGCAAPGATLGAGAAAEPVPSPVPPSPAVTVTHGVEHSLDIEQPPPFRVRYDDTELRLLPFTYCYRNGCVDGMDDDPPSVGSPDELFVFVPVPGFTQLTVGMREDPGECGARAFDAAVTPLGDGWWSVRPRGRAGAYTVDLFASGGGDMIASLRWQTTADLPLPEPFARLALIADHDGQPDSYGLELAVSNLEVSPRVYAASITVTAGNGASLTFAARPSTELCVGEGELYFDEPDSEALRAARLGDFPFTMTVELVLDGVTHVATAVYPDDEIEGYEPSVLLEFSPPLR